MELLVLGLLVTLGFLAGRATLSGAAPSTPGWAAIGEDDLEPFRSRFNDEADRVRLVLLVGPT